MLLEKVLYLNYGWLHVPLLFRKKRLELHNDRWIAWVQNNNIPLVMAGCCVLFLIEQDYFFGLAGAAGVGLAGATAGAAGAGTTGGAGVTFGST